MKYQLAKREQPIFQKLTFNLSDSSFSIILNIIFDFLNNLNIYLFSELEIDF